MMGENQIHFDCVLCRLHFFLVLTASCHCPVGLHILFPSLNLVPWSFHLPASAAAPVAATPQLWLLTQKRRRCCPLLALRGCRQVCHSLARSCTTQYHLACHLAFSLCLCLHMAICYKDASAGEPAGHPSTV